MKPVLVAGLGNPLMRDEGVGIRIVEMLAARDQDFPRAEFVDLGTGGLDVLHAMSGREKAVFIDCAFMGASPGEVRKFDPQQVTSVKAGPGASAHHGDLLRTIEIAGCLGDRPDRIVIFGIEPKCVAPGEELSQELEARLAEYVQAVAQELSSPAKPCP